MGLRSRYGVRSRIFAASSTLARISLLLTPHDLQGEAHVVGDRHVRVERVVLEHHGDVPVLGRQVGDVAVADADGAAVDVLQPREHPQRGGLAAAGGTDQDEELPVGDLDLQLVHRGLLRARVDARRLVERNRGHGDRPPSPAGTCRTIRVKKVNRPGDSRGG